MALGSVKTMKMKNGVFESIPNFGTLDSEFVSNLLVQETPIHTSVFWCLPMNMTVDEARNSSVKMAIERECEYVFFRDYDVICPPNALPILMSRNVDIIGGLYFSKSKPPWPLLFVDNKPSLEWSIGDVVKCDAIGMGCTLIKTEVFKKMEPPWFVTGGESSVEDAHLLASYIFTEDVHFCNRMKKELGISPYIDTSLNCAHKDLKTGQKYFFHEKEGSPAWTEKDGSVRCVLPVGHPKLAFVDLTVKESGSSVEEDSDHGPDPVVPGDPEPGDNHDHDAGGLADCHGQQGDEARDGDNG